MWNVSICRGKLQDLLEILTSKSGIMAEFSKYRFSRKEIDFQPNEVCSDLFHIKVYLTAEYERNRCFSCCHHFSKIFDFWQHSFLTPTGAPDTFGSLSFEKDGCQALKPATIILYFWLCLKNLLILFEACDC